MRSPVKTEPTGIRTCTQVQADGSVCGLPSVFHIPKDAEGNPTRTYRGLCTEHAARADAEPPEEDDDVDL